MSWDDGQLDQITETEWRFPETVDGLLRRLMWFHPDIEDYLEKCGASDLLERVKALK